MSSKQQKSKSKALPAERDPRETWSLWGRFAAGHAVVAIALSMTFARGDLLHHLGNALALVAFPHLLFLIVALPGIVRRQAPPANTWYATTALTSIWMTMFWLYKSGQFMTGGVNIARGLTLVALVFWLYQAWKRREERRHH